MQTFVQQNRYSSQVPYQNSSVQYSNHVQLQLNGITMAITILLCLQMYLKSYMYWSKIPTSANYMYIVSTKSILSSSGSHSIMCEKGPLIEGGELNYQKQRGQRRKKDLTISTILTQKWVNFVFLCGLLNNSISMWIYFIFGICK